VACRDLTAVSPVSPLLDAFAPACHEPAEDLACSDSLKWKRARMEDVFAEPPGKANHSFHSGPSVHAHIPECALIFEKTPITFRAHSAAFIQQGEIVGNNQVPCNVDRHASKREAMEQV